MYNQEQLAAIAAAMSVLQHSMQSNSPPNASPVSPVSSAPTNHPGHPHLTGVDSDLVSGLRPTAAMSTQLRALAQLDALSNHHQQAHHIGPDHPSQAVLEESLPFKSLAGGLVANDDSIALQYHSQYQRQDLPILAQTSPEIPLNHSQRRALQHQHQRQHDHHQQQQQALLNRYCSQLQQADYHRTTSPANTTPPKSLLVSPDSPHQQLQQQPQLPLQHPHLQQNNQQQLLPHQHKHTALVNQFQTHQIQSSDHLANIAPSPPKQPITSQSPQPSQQLQPQQPITRSPQAPQVHATVTQPTRPQSYSAIVAKSAGLQTNTTNNNVVGHGTLNGSVPNYNNHNNHASNHAPASNNTFGGLSNPTFSATNANHSINANSDVNTATNSKNLSSANNANYAFRGFGAAPATSHVIIRNSLTNHLASSNNNIYTSNNLTGNSLCHSNGSLLNHGNVSLALEPTIKYTTDHSANSPAQQLFQTQQNHHQTMQQLHQQTLQQNHQQQPHSNHISTNNSASISANSNQSSSIGSATNLLGFMGLYVGNLSPDLTKEQLEKIFSKYGEPVKAHRLIRSPVAFIKYENIESPRAAIDDLYGLLLPDLTLNQDQPLKLHFDRNDAQLKANYRPTELPKNDNGECYGWRTTVCKRGKNCPKKHIPINRGIDFQMWMIKTTPAAT